MTNILIIGAHGKVGKILSEKLKESSNFKPTALIRKQEQENHFKNLGIDTRVTSVEDSIETLTDAMDGMDAIVFSAGSGGNTGDDKTLTVDLDGAVKAMEAAERANIKRFVIVSALNVDKRDAWKASGLNTYYIAKHYADRILKGSNLNYTIIRPGLLLDTPGTGKITLTDPAAKKGVSREDVANLILAVLDHPNTIGKIIEFNEGETPIAEALNKIHPRS